MLVFTEMEEWARRLMSPWGNHYMCEEVRDGRRFSDHPVLEARGHTFTGAMLVCRQMWAECTQIMGEALEVTVTDIESALFLARLHGSAGTAPPDSDANAPLISRALLKSAQ